MPACNPRSVFIDTLGPLCIVTGGAVARSLLYDVFLADSDWWSRANGANLGAVIAGVVVFFAFRIPMRGTDPKSPEGEAVKKLKNFTVVCLLTTGGAMAISAITYGFWFLLPALWFLLHLAVGSKHFVNPRFWIKITTPMGIFIAYATFFMYSPEIGGTILALTMVLSSCLTHAYWVHQKHA